MDIKCCINCERINTPQWYSGPLCTCCWQRNNRARTRSRVNERKRALYRKNTEKILKQNAESDLRNIERLRVWRRKYEIEKRKTEPQYRLSKNLRRRIWAKIKKKSNYSGSSTELIGCCYPDLKIYLEKQFKPGMTWENYGSYWHVDHIRPLASFDLTKFIELKMATHYTNLQPLEAGLNMKKRAKYSGSLLTGGVNGRT